MAQQAAAVLPPASTRAASHDPTPRLAAARVTHVPLAQLGRLICDALMEAEPPRALTVCATVAFVADAAYWQPRSETVA